MENELSRISKLKGIENWEIWVFQIKVILKSNESYEIVTGVETKPELRAEPTQEAIKKVQMWTKKDGTAQKIIATTISEGCLIHIMNCDSSCDMWKKLHEIYENKSQTTVHLLQQQWFSVAKNKSDDIATHISKIKALAHKLNMLGEPTSDTMVITKIVMTLPRQYQHFITAWESTSENDRTLANLINRLTMEEIRMNANDKQSNNAFYSKANTKNHGKSMHPNNKSYKPGKCHRCGREGHWKNECRSTNVHHTPNNRYGGNKNEPKGEAFIGDVLAITANKGNENTNIWYLDSGASQHMSSKKSWFIEYEELLHPIPVKMGNGEVIYAKGKGKINIKAYNGTYWIEKHIDNVLHVPDLQYNLFSLTSVLDKGYKLYSDHLHCSLKRNGEIVAVGERIGNLYTMKFRTNTIVRETKHEIAQLMEKTSTLQGWHEKLVHQNIFQVKNYLNNMNIKFDPKEQIQCEPCILGKMHRKPLKNSLTKSQRPGELIHADLCGPMENTSVGNSRYFLLLKDDFSHYLTIIFLTHKSEVTDLIKEFIIKTETELKRKIEKFRTDNGTEFTNKEVESIMKEHGIKHERAVPYTPEQNGAIERENRTVVELSRTLLQAKNLPTKLWAEAAHTVVYILNRTYIRKPTNKTAYEIWYEKIPKSLQLQIFGTKAYVHIPKEKRKKWSAKAKPGIFVGYDEITKGYRIWFENENKVEKYRDVIFINDKNEHNNYKEHEEPKTYIYSNLDDPLQEQYEQEELEDRVIRDQPNIQDEQDDYQQQLENRQPPETPEEPAANPDGRYNLRNRNETRAPARYADYQLYIDNLFVSECTEPTNYQQAIEGAQKEKWKNAIQEEINSLIKNETWILTELPPNEKLLRNRWILKIKPGPNNTKIYKARLVVKGFEQEYGVDFFETYSPVVRYNSIRALLSVAVGSNMTIKQFDVKTAYLNGELHENIYMTQPIGYEDNTQRVCKLKKALYGLKQSARCWNETFVNFLTKFNLEPTDADPCVFTNHDKNKKLMLAIYVDDGIVASNNAERVEELLKYLDTHLEIKSNSLSLFLGMEFEYLDDGSLFVHQKQYIDKILNRFNMQEANPVAIPADHYQDLNIPEIKGTNDCVKVPYKEAIGSLLFLAMTTRPDIAYSVCIVSQYADKPMKIHWNAIKRILKYLKGTRDYGIIFNINNNNCFKLEAYSDADFAGDRISRKSMTGFIIMLNSVPIAWGSTKQRTVALSTTESEYIAACYTVKEIIWVNRLLKQLLNDTYDTPTLFVDNQSAIKLIKNPSYHKRTKHIDVSYHFIRQHYSENTFKLEYIESTRQTADIFTKALTRSQFETIRGLFLFKIKK